MSALSVPPVALVLQSAQSGTHSHLAFVTFSLPILSTVFLNSLLPAGLQIPLAAHPSASDSVTGWHCARFITYLLNYHSHTAYYSIFYTIYFQSIILRLLSYCNMHTGHLNGLGTGSRQLSPWRKAEKLYFNCTAIYKGQNLTWNEQGHNYPEFNLTITVVFITEFQSL